MGERYRLVEIPLEQVLREHGYEHLIKDGKIDHILAIKALAEIAAKDRTITFDGRTLKVYRKVPLENTSTS